MVLASSTFALVTILFVAWCFRHRARARWKAAVDAYADREIALSLRRKTRIHGRRGRQTRALSDSSSS